MFWKALLTHSTLVSVSCFIGCAAGEAPSPVDKTRQPHGSGPLLASAQGRSQKSSDISKESSANDSLRTAEYRVLSMGSGASSRGVVTSYWNLFYYGKTTMGGRLERYINHALPLPHVLIFPHTLILHSHNLVTESVTGSSSTPWAYVSHTTPLYLHSAIPHKHLGRVGL